MKNAVAQSSVQSMRKSAGHPQGTRLLRNRMDKSPPALEAEGAQGAEGTQGAGSCRMK